MAILEVLANSRAGQTLSELSRLLGLPKSSTHRLLITLEAGGYLYRNAETGRYYFSLKLFTIANMALGRTSLREQTEPVLYSLMRKTGLTVHIAILEQNQAFIIDKIEPPGFPRLGTWIGKSMDLHCTGVGKAFLAYLPEEERVHALRNGMPRYNDNTITSPRKLKAQLDEIRRAGYAVDDEEETIGLRCVGVPILDSANRPIAAISIAGTISQITEDNVEALASVVRKCATTISERLSRSPDRDMTQASERTGSD
jgi:DNA-binding IclR family transcriptional regulator